MGNQLLEYVAEIHRDIPSSGAVEQQAVADGAASARVVAKAFPVLPGSHLKMESPALEFIKMVSHLVELDAPLQERSLAKGSAATASACSTCASSRRRRSTPTRA